MTSPAASPVPREQKGAATGYVARHALTSHLADYDATASALRLIVERLQQVGGPVGKAYRPQHAATAARKRVA